VNRLRDELDKLLDKRDDIQDELDRGAVPGDWNRLDKTDERIEITAKELAELIKNKPK
jgi:hypothetical protein